MVASYAVYNMNEYISFAVLILLVLACVVHVVIHRVAAIEKWWATVVVAAVYTLLLTGMLISAAAYGRLRVESGSGQWVTSIGFVIINLSTLMSFFTDAPFLGHFLWWFVATALYYGLGVTTIGATVKIDESYNAIRNGANAVSGCVILTMYSIILLFGSCLRDISNRKQFLQRVLMVKQQNQIIREKSRNERMQRHFLENILPASVVEKLQLQQEQWSLQLQHDKIQTSSISQRHFGVGMLYADLVGFTSFCKQVDPFSVMVFLNDLFEVFDGLCDDFNVYKVETVGDCYVATVGVVTGEQTVQDVSITDSMPKTSTASRTNAKDLVSFAKAMVWGSRQVKKPVLDTPALLRVGLHTGSCISGIIGTRNFKFSLLGDDVTIAAAMEKTGVPDCIHASEDVVKLVPEERWEKCKVHEAAVQSGVTSFLLSV